jgi:Leucine-rich repeat (LRR) protein
MTTIIDLPTNSDVYPTILSFLGHSSISNLQKTCNTFRHIVNLSITSLTFSDECLIITLQGMMDRVAAFPNLETVIIRLHDSIEFEVFQVLTMITELSCGWLEFPGHSLASLSTCTKLVSLDLSHAKFSDEGMEPLSLLTNLEKLNMEYCTTITGTGFQYLTSLTKLHTLNVSSTSITSDGFYDIGQLSSLIDLNCMDCLHMSILSLVHLSNLKLLENLNIQFAKELIDITPIGEMPSLEYLNIDNCERLTVSDVDSWSRLDNLKTVTFYSSFVSDDILKCVSRLPSLENLDLGNNNMFTSIGIRHLISVTSLEDLYMPHCDHLTNHAFEHLAQMTQLTSLTLSSCNSFDARGLVHLTNLTSLVELDVENCENITIDHTDYLVKRMPNTRIHRGGGDGFYDDPEYFHVATQFWENNN